MFTSLAQEVVPMTPVTSYDAISMRSRFYHLVAVSRYYCNSVLIEKNRKKTFKGDLNDEIEFRCSPHN